MAIPPSFPDRVLRHMPRPEQPGHPMAGARIESGHPIPPHIAPNQPSNLASSLIRARRSLHHLRAQMRLLLGSSEERVLPPREGQLLLRPLGRVHVPCHRRATLHRTGGPAPSRVVRVHGPHHLPRPQGLRAVALRGEEAPLQGGEPLVTSVRCGELRGGDPGGQSGVVGGREVPVGDRVRPLSRGVRHLVPEAADE